jgi:hypothetical protein
VAEGEFDMDAAEAAYNAGRQEDAPEGLSQPPGEEDDLPLADVDEINADDVPGELPPGFKSYDAYVKDGGDPDMYRGRKAYEAEHTRINENKALRDEVRGLNVTVQQTMEATQQVLSQTEARVRQEVEGELQLARENDDVDAAITAQNKLNQIDTNVEQRQAPAAQPKGESPAITAYRAKNPLIDSASPQFNQEFNTAVEKAFNNFARQGLTGSPAETERALKASMGAAQTLFPELFESPRNGRQQSQQRQRQRAPQGDNVPKAEDYQIAKPRNPRDVNAASDVRETIRASAINNAKKRGLNEADQTKAGNKAAKDFEKSLAK